jgi:hypothetical protein
MALRPIDTDADESCLARCERSGMMVVGARNSFRRREEAQ